MRRLVLIPLLCVSLMLLLSGCFFVAPSGCVNDSDCAVDTFCASGACVVPENIDCDSDLDCPNTTACDVLDGYCYLL
jgi:hypothetical protein